MTSDERDVQLWLLQELFLAARSPTAQEVSEELGYDAEDLIAAHARVADRLRLPDDAEPFARRSGWHARAGLEALLGAVPETPIVYRGVRAVAHAYALPLWPAFVFAWGGTPIDGAVVPLGFFRTGEPVEVGPAPEPWTVLFDEVRAQWGDPADELSDGSPVDTLTYTSPSGARTLRFVHNLFDGFVEKP